jgi:hypothetical protein
MHEIPSPWRSDCFYVLRNGRHRSIALWRTGRQHYPAFVIGPAREEYRVRAAHGSDWDVEVAREAWERSRTGLRELTGPVRVADRDAP